MTVTLTEESFLAQAEPLRRELQAHCYRMTGSVHDAEDLVQETLLRAWRAVDRFEQRSSLRTWLYRIATNTCLTALEGRARRPLPTGLGAPPGNPSATLVVEDLPWLEPAPDDVLWATPAPDPATAAAEHDSVRLAFVAALQHLTAQQRAVLLLRDVLCWHADEVAEALGLSVGAVTSTLQRARAHVAKLAEPPALPDDDPRVRALLDEYVEAFEAYDVERIVALLTQDAVWEMPPYVEWYRGAPDIGRLIEAQCPAQRAGDMRMMRTSANGRTAFAMYMRGDDGVHRAFQLQHVLPTADGVAHVTVWFDRDLFARFGLPLELPGAGA